MLKAVANTDTAHPYEGWHLKMANSSIPDEASDTMGEQQKKCRFLLEQKIGKVS
jgi:hypothetical protein